jgi:competence protein ComFC
MNRAIKFLKDILFPIYCVGCETEGEWWCQNCRNQNQSNIVLGCPVCFTLNSTGRPCTGCQNNSHLTGVVSLFHYAENAPIGKLIKLFKYNYAADIVRLWQNILADNREQLKTIFSLSDTSVIPIPLYSRRERERGFNQAGILGKIIAEQLGFPFITNQLTRTRATAQQAKLSRANRQTNVAGAFVWQSGSVPASVILIDDVYTTGATMQECARVLKATGVGEIWGLTLARD